jgi:hypothetical protein
MRAHAVSTQDMLIGSCPSAQEVRTTERVSARSRHSIIAEFLTFSAKRLFQPPFRRRFRIRSGRTSLPHVKFMGDHGRATTAIRIGDPGALQVLAKNLDRFATFDISTVSAQSGHLTC